ncbi:MAG: sulfatase, partial [Pirellulales bacterium]
MILLIRATLTAPTLLAAERSDPPPRPNIIFVFSDDHASRAISAYGSKINHTPNIDRLAREGMLFRNCYVTNSICGPSRAVILTGKYSHLNGFFINGNTFDGGQQTFPKILQRAGYQTAVFGKWHLKSVPTGFDHFDVLIGQGPYYNPRMKTRDAEGNVVIRKHVGYTTDVITDKVLAWLGRQRDPQRPFLLMYQHKAPHRNWLPGPKHLTLFDDTTIPEPETFWDDYRGRASPAREQEMTVAEHLTEHDLKLTEQRGLTAQQRARWNAAYEPKNRQFREAHLTGKDLVRWKYQRYIKDYLRCVQSVDDNLGRLLDYLDRSGLSRSTVVVYSSDQGWYLGEHGWFDKRWMYQESLIMPLIVRWPGRLQPGSESEAIVSNVDFAETFLDMAGAPIPREMQGRSLVPILRGQPPTDWRGSFYYHYYEFPGAHHVARH